MSQFDAVNKLLTTVNQNLEKFNEFWKKQEIKFPSLPEVTKFPPMPTVVQPLELEENQVWYVRLPGGTTVTRCFIGDVSEKTVVLKEYQYSAGNRYVTTEVEFIEKLN